MKKIIEAFRGSRMISRSVCRQAGVPLVFALMAGACDHGPAELALQEEAPKTGLATASIMEGPYSGQSLITCNVTVATAVVTCVSPQDPDPLVNPPVGGRGVFVRMRPISPAYIPDSLLFRTGVRMKNQMIHRIGSYSGPVTGLKVFFVEAPVVTQGTGAVSVLNEDGTAEFTALGQDYFLYNQVLKSLQQTTLKTWKFSVAATVQKFRFKVYVSANILPIIAFDMSQAGNRDIYRVNADGSDLVRLTTNAGADVTPTVARDRIVFTSYRNGNADLYSMSLVGGGQTRLTNTTWHETDPNLTLDDASLAYVSTETGERRVWYGPSTLATRTQIPSFGSPSAIHAKPVWESDGLRLIYGSSDGGSMNLYRFTLATGVGTKLITTPSRTRFDPKMSHDYKKVVHVSPNLTGANSEIYIYDKPTGTTTRLTDRAEPDIQPTFLQDNNRIAWIRYTTDTDGKLRWQTLDGLTVVSITLPAQPANPYGVPLW